MHFVFDGYLFEVNPEETTKLKINDVLYREYQTI